MPKNPHVVAILQARLGSTRLPEKTLKIIFDKPLLEHIIERVRAARRVHEVVVATSTARQDDPIADLAQRVGVHAFRGSEDNVLERFYGAAARHAADVCVRVTADDPFKDPEIIDQAIALLLENKHDYCSNTMQPTYPEGLDIEVFRFVVLQRAFKEASLPSDAEHVTPYIWKHPELFALHNFQCAQDLSHLRWTIDYENDLLFAREVYKRLYPEKHIFLMRDILKLLADEPSLSAINGGVARNEGYQKSLKKEAAQ
jgi:spore coat polysaccharide biosynthesis protein SpsF